MVQAVHRIARCYGKRPHEIAFGGLNEFEFDMQVYIIGGGEKDTK